MSDESRNPHEPDEEGFVPGIYNYCDRWCERCPHTRQCRNFSLGKDLDAMARLDTEAQRKAFWESLDGAFLATRRRLACASSGIDVDAEGLLPDVELPMEEGAPRERPEPRTIAADADPLVQQARAYFDAASPWLDQGAEKFRGTLDELVQAARLELPQRSPRAELRQLQELSEVVRWYHPFIRVKMRRVAGILVGEDEDGGELSREVEEDDLLGTTKVTLIAIDRSMAAWIRLLEKLPEEEEAILPFLARLERLRKALEAAVPGARAFIRPGLDAPPRA